MSNKSPLVLGVVIVTYNSEDVILDCLESLLAARSVRLHIVLVDNASTDRTVETLRDWASGAAAHAPPAVAPFAVPVSAKPLVLHEAAPGDAPEDAGLTLLHAGVNGGFAAGVNLGLAHLAQRPEIERFWILNPDSLVPPDTPAAFAAWPEPEGGFSLMGGRLLYHDAPERIQGDGGRYNRLTGVTSNINFSRRHAETAAPSAKRFDFICGGSMVASRAFCERAGSLPEDYFLYYEEVDWAQRRGDLPLVHCPSGIVYHRAGTAIGSPTMSRGPSVLSAYFLHRARMRFMRRHHPASLPIAYGYGLSKAAQFLLKGHRAQAAALLRALHGAGPPVALRAVLGPGALRRLSAGSSQMRSLPDSPGA